MFCVGVYSHHIFVFFGHVSVIGVQALRAAIKSLTTSVKKRKEKIAALQTALELDSAVSRDFLLHCVKSH